MRTLAVGDLAYAVCSIIYKVYMICCWFVFGDVSNQFNHIDIKIILMEEVHRQ